MLTRYFARPGGGILIALLTLFCFLCFSLNAILCRSALAACGMDPLRFVEVRCFSGAAYFSPSGPLPGRGGRGALAGAHGPKLMAMRHLSVLLYALFRLRLCGHALGKRHADPKFRHPGQHDRLGRLLRAQAGRRQLAGLALAFAGLALLLAPGLSSPPFINALLIALAGLSWGAYTMAGRAVADPGLSTAGNFLRASLPAVGVLLLSLMNEAGSRTGLEERARLYAIASGAGTSALGYKVWYVVQPGLSMMASSASQLAVPPITAVLGLVLLGEAISLRLVVCGLMILAGIWLGLRAAGRSVGA